MSSVTEEIQQLQLRILELEEQQKEKDESDKKTSIDHNFKVINDVLTEKKTAINNNRYSKSVPLARYYDQELVTHLEAIYNILQKFIPLKKGITNSKIFKLLFLFCILIDIPRSLFFNTDQMILVLKKKIKL